MCVWGSNSRPNVSEGYEVPLSYRGDRWIVHFVKLLLEVRAVPGTYVCEFFASSGSWSIIIIVVKRRRFNIEATTLFVFWIKFVLFD